MVSKQVTSVCFVTTSPLIVNFFLVPHLIHLRKSHTVTLVVNAQEGVALKPLPGIEVISVPIQRKIAPMEDLRTLGTLVALFRRRRFDVVHSFSPKAGLLAITASALAGVPRRIHTFTGQVWATRRGRMRMLLKLADCVVGAVATHVLADSRSQQDYLERQGVVRPGKCQVLGQGSITGVDLDRFRPDVYRRALVRRELQIPDDAFVALFLGRITQEKGVLELVQACRAMSTTHPELHLLLVGPDEEGLLKTLWEPSLLGRIHIQGYTKFPEHYVAASDVLCLPSHREGFGSVIIEAAAAGVPAVASRIYGVTDAIVEGETGLLHKPGDVNDIARQLARIIEDSTLRFELAQKAKRRAMSEFSQARVTQELSEFYESLLVPQQ
jgi:glycosyltransferase involved in cell wall biosynthesis